MDEIGYIDWERCCAVGRGLVRPGPKLAAGEIKELVASIRGAAVKAEPHIAEVTQLDAGASAAVKVLDRGNWIEACAASGQAIMTRLGASAEPSKRIERVDGITRGVQFGVAFAAAATRILGQFDPFSPEPKLLLVAPNIYKVGRELMVDAPDFQLWVCLHEETHRFQFGHTPWLPEHLLSSISALLEAGDGISWPKKRSGQTGQTSIISMVLTEPQREHFDRISAIMSLLEGHADVMMDRVGTKVVPTLPIIRKAFEARRDRRGWAALVGKLIGTDLKLAQYRDGAVFCRAVIEQLGVAGLNQAFSSPEMLPSLAEIHDPDAWVKRVG